MFKSRIALLLVVLLTSGCTVFVQPSSPQEASVSETGPAAQAQIVIEDNIIACNSDRHTLDQDIKLYFALNGALFDASIAAWDAKRAYDSTRPASAIPHLYAGQQIEAWAGPNLGTQQIPGEKWKPYQELTFVTPAFPEYVSGHSTFSAAAAQILTLFTGSNKFYDGETVLPQDFNRDGVPDMLGEHITTVSSSRFEDSPKSVVVLKWPTFQDAADEAGISRLYGGIHIQDSDLQGRRMGKQIADQTFALAERYWNGTINQ